jgi:hypothetical protein
MTDIASPTSTADRDDRPCSAARGARQEQVLPALWNPSLVDVLERLLGWNGGPMPGLPGSRRPARRSRRANRP